MKLLVKLLALCAGRGAVWHETVGCFGLDDGDEGTVSHLFAAKRREVARKRAWKTHKQELSESTQKSQAKRMVACERAVPAEAPS